MKTIKYPAYQIREAALTDVEAVVHIASNLNLSHWSLNDYRQELAHLDSRFLVANNEADNKIIGFIVTRLITMDYKIAEIYNIGVEIKFQAQGIGKNLLLGLFALCCKESVEEIWLEVRSRNWSAISFYESFGFQVIDKRKNYYSNPKDDALIMTKNLRELF